MQSEDIRIFWPTTDDLFRIGGIVNLISEEESMTPYEKEVAINQLFQYKYDCKEDEYSPKVLAADTYNSYGDFNAIIGYTLYRKSWIRPKTFETAQVLVHKDFRGKRVASLLRSTTWDDIRYRGGDYLLSATKDTGHMKSAKQLDELQDGWKIMGRYLNSI
jgi:GNAT superfamily N-acetyltransferase